MKLRVTYVRDRYSERHTDQHNHDERERQDQAVVEVESKSQVKRAIKKLTGHKAIRIISVEVVE